MKNIRLSLSVSPHPVLGQDAFHSCLNLERRRAARAHKSLVLVFFDPASNDVDGIVRIVSSRVRATDWIGWLENGKRLGVLFTEIDAERGPSTAKLLHDKIAKSIASQIDTDLATGVTLELCSPRKNNDGLLARPVLSLVDLGKSK